MHGPDGGERKHSAAAPAGCREGEGAEHPSTRSAAAAVASAAEASAALPVSEFASAATRVSRVSAFTARAAKVAGAVRAPGPTRVAAPVLCRLLPVRMRGEAVVMKVTLLLLLLLLMGVVKSEITVWLCLSATGVPPWACSVWAGAVADAAAAAGTRIPLATRLAEEACVAAGASLRLLRRGGDG